MLNDKLDVDNYVVGDVNANTEVTQLMQYLILQKGYFTVKLFDSAAILTRHNTEIKKMKAGLLKQFCQANNLKKKEPVLAIFDEFVEIIGEDGKE